MAPIEKYQIPQKINWPKNHYGIVISGYIKVPDQSLKCTNNSTLKTKLELIAVI
jgi:hypothetical protein